MCACQYSGGRGRRVDAAIDGIGREGRASKNKGRAMQKAGRGYNLKGEAGRQNGGLKREGSKQLGVSH
jgi:hypothetical protein